MSNDLIARRWRRYCGPSGPACCSQAGSCVGVVPSSGMTSPHTEGNLVVAANHTIAQFIASGARIRDVTHEDMLPFEWQSFIRIMPPRAHKILQESSIVPFFYKVEVAVHTSMVRPWSILLPSEKTGGSSGFTLGIQRWTFVTSSRQIVALCTRVN